MWRGKRKKSPTNYGTRSLSDIFPVKATINADTTVAAQTSKLESEDDGNEVRMKTATRSVSTASTAFAAANPTTMEESSEDNDDDDLINYTLHIPSTATSFKKNHNASAAFAAAIANATDPRRDRGFQCTNLLVKIPPSRMGKRNRSMLKDPPGVFEAAVNDDDQEPPLPLNWTRLSKSPTDSFDIVKIEEVKWGMRICNCGCQEIADPTTSVQFHDEHGDNQAWLSEEFNTQTNYSIKLVPIRILSDLKHVEMYREAAREMWSLPEYHDNYVFIEYIIHLMIQEYSDDRLILSIVIQVTLCSTARLGASMLEYGWSNKGNSEKSPSEYVGDALSDAFAWPENAIDYMNGWNYATIVARQPCRLVCCQKNACQDVVGHTSMDARACTASLLPRKKPFSKQG